MAITLVSWNMDWWKRTPAQRAAAWAYLDEELHADVALVQEAAEVPSGHSVIGDLTIDEWRPWGTAVVSRDHELNPVTAVRRVRHTTRPYGPWKTGTAATATVTVRGTTLTLVSLYGLLSLDGWSYPSVNGHLAQLAPLLDSPDHWKQVLVGGDLNLTTQWEGEDAGYAPIDAALLQQFCAWGLRDLIAEGTTGVMDGCGCADEPCRHVQTHWHSRSPRRWQNDYVFLSSRFPHPVTTRVDGDAVRSGLSDHAPVVVTIEEAHEVSASRRDQRESARSTEPAPRA